MDQMESVRSLRPEGGRAGTVDDQALHDRGLESVEAATLRRQRRVIQAR
jgi:hypothetical protein